MEKPPESPSSRLVCGQEKRRFGRERKGGQDGGKAAFFFRSPWIISADLFSSRNKRCSHISPQQRTDWLRCVVLSVGLNSLTVGLSVLGLPS